MGAIDKDKNLSIIDVCKNAIKALSHKGHKNVRIAFPATMDSALGRKLLEIGLDHPSIKGKFAFQKISVVVTWKGNPKEKLKEPKIPL